MENAAIGAELGGRDLSGLELHSETFLLCIDDVIVIELNVQPCFKVFLWLQQASLTQQPWKCTLMQKRVPIWAR